MGHSKWKVVALAGCVLGLAASRPVRAAGARVVDCDASAMEDVNWALAFLDQHLPPILDQAGYLPSKYRDRLLGDWDKTTLKCSAKGSCAKFNGVIGFHSTGDTIKLCWDNVRQPGLSSTRCSLVGTIVHEKAHAANVPIEAKHDEWTQGYFYVPSIDLVYRLGNDAAAYCAQVAGLGDPADWSSGTDPVESHNGGKLAIGDYCSRDTQCVSNSCEKGICTCHVDKDCTGDLRCVNRLGKNFCVPPADTLGSYCKKDGDCGVGTCNNNVCVCKVDKECNTIVAGSPRCAKPFAKKNFCQPTRVAMGSACNHDSDCASGKCKGDLCVAH